MGERQAFAVTVTCFWVYSDGSINEYRADVRDPEHEIVCVVSYEALDKRVYVLKNGTVRDGGSVVV